MDYTKQLEIFEQTFDTFLELDESGFEVETECLRNYYDENYCDWDKEHEALYWKVEGLLDIAGANFNGIHHQERMDNEADERSYLTSEGNS